MTYLRLAFFVCFVRPLLVLILGLNIRHLERLRAVAGGHLVAANHNSHLDALVLLSLFQLKDLPRVKIVAAKDYFCKTPLRTWLSLNLIGIIPIDRQGGTADPLAPVAEALGQGRTVIMFPEGSRGEAEVRQPFRFGIAKLLEQFPAVKITPIYLHGLGKALPRGESLLVPFNCNGSVGEDIAWDGDRASLIARLEAVFDALAAEVAPRDLS